MSAKASQILLTRLYVQQPIQAKHKQPQMLEHIQWEVGLIWVKHRHPNCMVILQMSTIVSMKKSGRQFMMMSSNGNIFHVTGPLCGEFTGPGEFPTQRPVTRSFDVFFDLRLNKRLSKQSWGWWFVTPSRTLWRHCIESANYLSPELAIVSLGGFLGHCQTHLSCCLLLMNTS